MVFLMISSRSRWALLTCILILCANNEALPQSPDQTNCPRVTVSCANTLQPTYQFTASVTEADANQRFAYHWTVSAGKIVSGQGTPVITVIGEPTLTATVRLTGLPSVCIQTTASCSVNVGYHHVPPVQKIDQFGSIPFQKVKPHLDKLAHDLRNSPGALGSIVSTRKWALAKNAVDYLLSKHGIPSERILLVDQKRKGPLLIKLFIVPPGASPPS
jgi:hypothetical protein